MPPTEIPVAAPHGRVPSYPAARCAARHEHCTTPTGESAQLAWREGVLERAEWTELDLRVTVVEDATQKINREKPKLKIECSLTWNLK